MDLERMNRAAQLLVGEHDFRNFCKMDLSQTTNFVRRVLKVEFREKYKGASSSAAQTAYGNPYHVHQLPIIEVEIRGLSFLWHQIRCIMAVLFLVGKGLEEESIVSTLLDIEKTPRKPNYELADDAGLVLYDCVFEDVKFESAAGELFKVLQMRAQRDAAIMDVLNGEEPRGPENEEQMKEVEKRENAIITARSNLSQTSGGGSNRPYSKLLNRAVAPSLDEKLGQYNAKVEKIGGVEKRDCSRMANDKDIEKALKLTKVEKQRGQDS